MTTAEAAGMDALDRLLGVDLSPAGAAALTAVIGRMPLAAADLSNGLGGTLIRALVGTTVEGGGPSDRAAATVLAAVVTQAHRMIGWWQAIEVRALAALARPGVATPLDQVLSAASSAITPASAGIESLGTGDENGLLGRDFEVEHYGGTSVFGRPEWDATVADHAARFAAAEIGASLGMSPVTAAARVAEAVMFVDELPETLTCWGMALSIVSMRWRWRPVPPCWSRILAERWSNRCSATTEAGRRDVGPQAGCARAPNDW